MRALALAVCLAGCSALDPFDADRGRFDATVRGALTMELRGSGYLGGLASDDPPTSSIVLTDTDAPTVEFQFPGGGPAAGTYAFPADARATFEQVRYAGAAFVATAGRVTVERPAEGVARGTFSFTARRGTDEITVEGSYTAE